MRLIVENPELSQPTVPVRWCLTPEELQRLEQVIGQKDNVNVIILVEYETESGEHEHKDVHILPLNQAMHYLPFHRAGKVKLLPFVLWGNWHPKLSQAYRGQIKAVKEIFEYHISTSSPHALTESMKAHRFDYWCSIIGEELTVNVPNGVFAKEPSELEKWWVNLWFNSKPEDQCQFRKRRFLAYSVQPICVLAWLFVDVFIRFWLAFIETLAGFKNVAWQDVFHPFEATIENIFDSGIPVKKTSYSTERTIKQAWIWFSLISIIVLMVLSIKTMPTMLRSGLIRLLYCLAVIIISSLAIPVFRAVLFILKWTACPVLLFLGKIVVQFFFPSDEETIAERRRLNKEKKRLEQERLFADAMETLSCECNPSPELSALPPKHQTIYLKFLETKARVCRPFQR